MTRNEVLKEVRESQRASRRPTFARADLANVDLSGVRLKGAWLLLANLTGADLSGADLASADLQAADLSGADLSGADLRRAAILTTKLAHAKILDAKEVLRRVGRPRVAWEAHLPADPEHRRLVKHLIVDGWGGTLREAIETAGELAGR